jgi:hypothetical protein
MSYYLLDYNPGTQQWGYPRRGASLSGTIIVHTAECAADNYGEDTSAEGCASMIANRADYGSYHRLVDSDSIIAMLPWEYEAWQDSETNPWAVGISAALRTSDWAIMPADRRERVYRNLAACAADFVSYMATKGITVPLRRITGSEARARVPGFCAHGDSGIARTDPGADFDWALFFRYTQEALNGGGIAAQGSIQEDDMANVSDDQLTRLLNAADRVNGVITDEHAKVLTTNDIDDIANKVLETEVPLAGGGTTTLKTKITFLKQEFNVNQNLIASVNAKLDALAGLVASGSAASKEEILAQLDASVKASFDQYEPTLVKKESE